jgi:hypothetical protein
VEERSDLGEGLGDVRSKRSSGEEKRRVLLLLLLMLLARGVVSRVGEARKNGRRDGANDILRSPKEGKEEVLNFDGSEGWTNTEKLELKSTRHAPLSSLGTQSSFPSKRNRERVPTSSSSLHGQ